MSNRRQIVSSSVCGCFYCLKTFPPGEITEWVDVDEVSEQGLTAICPYCGIDSVVGFPDGYTDVQAHLQRRNKTSFG